MLKALLTDDNLEGADLRRWLAENAGAGLVLDAGDQPSLHCCFVCYLAPLGFCLTLRVSRQDFLR